MEFPSLFQRCIVPLWLITAALFVAPGSPVAAQALRPAVGSGSDLSRDLEVKRAVFKRPPPGVSVAALYLILHNKGSKPLEITEIHVVQAQSSVLHETVTDSQGVSRMQHRSQITIPPGQTVEMAPGGLHVMVTGLPAPLDSKMLFEVRIESKGRGQLQVKASVEP